MTPLVNTAIDGSVLDLDNVQYEVVTDISGNATISLLKNTSPVTSTDSQTLEALDIEHTNALKTIKTLESEVAKYKLKILHLENQARTGIHYNYPTH